MREKVVSVLILIASAIFVFFVVKDDVAADAARRDYQALPATAKVESEALFDRLRTAKRGVLIEDADGRISMVIRIKKLGLGNDAVEAEVKTSLMCLTSVRSFYLYDVRAKLKDVVGKDDPRFGKLALRFLNQ